MEADSLLPEQERRSVAQPDERRDEQEERRQHDERGGGDDDVEEALDGDPQDPVRPVDQRQDRDAVEVLDAAARDDQGRLIDRDPDDAALVLAQPGDRLDQRPVLETETDGHLIDDGAVHDGLDLLDGAEDRSREARARAGRFVMGTREVADRPKPELDVARDGVGERLGRRIGADDQHVARVVPECPKTDEHVPDDGPRQERQGCLAREQQEEEESADVRQLDQVERREDDDREEDDGDEDVDDLAAQRETGAQAIETLEPERDDEGEAVPGGCDEGVDPGGRPRLPPAG